MEGRDGHPVPPCQGKPCRECSWTGGPDVCGGKSHGLLDAAWTVSEPTAKISGKPPKSRPYWPGVVLDTFILDALSCDGLGKKYMASLCVRAQPDLCAPVSSPGRRRGPTHADTQRASVCPAAGAAGSSASRAGRTPPQAGIFPIPYSLVLEGCPATGPYTASV